MKINVNEKVKVKLTPLGVDVYYHRFDGLIERGIKITRRMPAIDKDGFTELQLHEIMNLYGEYMDVGCEQVFVDNTIYYNE